MSFRMLCNNFAWPFVTSLPMTKLFVYTRITGYPWQPGEMGRRAEDTCCLSHYYGLQCARSQLLHQGYLSFSPQDFEIIAPKHVAVGHR